MNNEVTSVVEQVSERVQQYAEMKGVDYNPDLTLAEMFKGMDSSPLELHVLLFAENCLSPCSSIAVELPSEIDEAIETMPFADWLEQLGIFEDSVCHGGRDD